MKIQNKEIGIKIGKKELKFTNMILDSYLDLFANSFISFKDKSLPYCLINFTHYDNVITETSTEMNYDIVLEADPNQNVEILAENSIINKYYYRTPLVGQEWDTYKNMAIMDIGFANYDYDLNKYVIYAYLDVSKYNIVVQDNQPIIISRTDKITSDMEMWTNSTQVEAPYHLTNRGMLNLRGYEYQTIAPKLYSIGFGVLPYTLNKEYTVEELDIQKTGIGEIKINNVLEAQYRPNAKYFNTDIYFNNDWCFEEPSYNYLIYKFKLYRETYPNPEEPPVWEDTGMFYLQYKEINKNGKINLSVKYERS